MVLGAWLWSVSWRDAMKRAKYGNRKTFVDGVEFDSSKEARRYRQLLFLQKQGFIRDLETQPKFKYFENERWIFSYSADFQYWDCEKEKQIIEDVKSPATKKNPTYRLKKKLIEARHQITITEV